MARLKITTWNINSVRLRLDRVLGFLEREAPDILCLQEIKCLEDQFPAKALAAVGYQYQHVVGQKGSHGVATIARHPVEPLDTPDFCRHGHARVAATSCRGISVHNIYLPAGGDEPDPETNDKFAHKLDFVARMTEYYRAHDRSDPLIVLGDLNIAPEEHDVWSHKQLLKVVSHTPVETAALKALIAAGAFTDIARVAHKPMDKLYTWWSYRARDWRASNRGRRLDHIWSNESMTPGVDMNSYTIHTDDRDGEKPSDHAPVSVELTT